MISLTFVVSDLSTVMQIYDRIQLMRYTGTGMPSAPVNLSEGYTTMSGVDTIGGGGGSRTGVSDILLSASYSQYYFTDPDGGADDWYISRYYSESTGSVSGWSDPILGQPGDLYYNPLYPPEIEFGSADQLVIDRIRLLMGDPIGLRREYGEDAASSIHPDGKTYELDEKGWPVSVYMNNKSYNESTSNPSINGYRFLRFTEDISTTTWSGCQEYGVDIWYYTFLYSDRQIMEAYDNCPPPIGLTVDTATPEAYMLKTAYELLYQQVFNDTMEDGAVITDEGSRYDPSPGLNNRKALLDNLKKRLEDLVNTLIFTATTGVRID